MALDLAARLSRGEPLPFCEEAAPPITVLYQTAEDGVDDIIKPRLVAAGADCTRIKFVEEGNDPLSFTDERIEVAIRQVNAKLLILDPLSAYIGIRNYCSENQSVWTLPEELRNKEDCIEEVCNPA